MVAVCCLWVCLPVIANALTTEEILLLKQNGVSEKTIQMMLESEIQAGKNLDGEDTIGIRTIIRSNGQPAIVYSTGEGDRHRHDAHERWKEEQAWEMLRRIVIDTRKDTD